MIELTKGGILMTEQNKAIETLLSRYFNAVYEADIDTLKTIFHPDASMNGFLGPDMIIGTPQIFYDDLSSKPSMKDDKIQCDCEIKEITIHGNIASASIYVTNFFGMCNVMDIFHLLNIDDEWKILCKTFTTI